MRLTMISVLAAVAAFAVSDPQAAVASRFTPRAKTAVAKRVPARMIVRRVRAWKAGEDGTQEAYGMDQIRQMPSRLAAAKVRLSDLAALRAPKGLRDRFFLRKVDARGLVDTFVKDNVASIEKSLREIDLEKGGFTRYIRENLADPSSGAGNFGSASAYETERQLARAHLENLSGRVALLRAVRRMRPGGIDPSEQLSDATLAGLERRVRVASVKISEAIRTVNAGPLGKYVKGGGADRDFATLGGDAVEGKDRGSFFDRR